MSSDSDGTWSTREMLAAMEQAHKTGISITCSQDRHGSCFGCRCDCHTKGGPMRSADSGYRAFHDGCGGMVAFLFGDDGYCTGCEDENVGFGDYTLVAVKPPAPEVTSGGPQ